MLFAATVEWSLRHRALVLIAAALLLLLGAFVAPRLQVDVLPDLTRPTVNVQTEAPNLAPEDVEAQVSVPLEAALAGLPGVTRLRSVSAPGLSLVVVEFDWSVDVWRSRQLAAERIEVARPQLPATARPQIGAVSSLMGEILLVGLHGGDPFELREQASFRLRPALLALPGVSQVTVIGGSLRQYEVRPDLDRMRIFGLSLAQITQSLRGYGEDAGAGFAQTADAEVPVRQIATPFRLDALRQVAVGYVDRAPIRLEQVAEVGVGSRLKRGDAGVNGDSAVIVAVQKQPGQDSLRLTTDLEARLAELDAGLPEGARRTVLFRQSDFIRASVSNVREALFHGALIVAVVLTLFLAGQRATLIALTAIPLSVVAAILVLHALGQSINTLTLGGIAIAVGELVDDAVVGIENVLRRLRLTPDPHADTVRQATVEVRSGILYATVIIVLVFLPLFALGGIEGRLFVPLGLAYIAAILASLCVAVTVTPVLCQLAFARKHGARAPAERRWLHELKQATPGLDVGEQAQFSTIFLRGVGSDAFLMADPSVASYIDGIYFPFAQGQAQDFGAVERLEVLKGPQGTLFGRNAVGGAISVLTRDPDFAGSQTSVEFGYGSRDNFETRAYQNLPLTDSLAINISAFYFEGEHYMRGLAAGEPLPNERSRGVRAKLRWAPTDELDVILAGVRTEQEGTGSVFTLNNAPTALVGSLLLQIDPQTGYRGELSEPTFLDFENTVGYGQVKYAAPWFDLKLLGSDQHVESVFNYDFDGSARPAAAFDQKLNFADIQTAELQILSNDETWGAERLKWIVGGYYFKSIQGFDTANLQLLGLDLADFKRGGISLPLLLLDALSALEANFPNGDIAFHAIIGTLSKSAFAQATLTVTDWLALTAGARYQDEARYLIRSDSGLFLSDGGFQTLFNWNALGARDGNGDPFPIRDTTTSFRPKATIELCPFDDRTLLYFSYQEALKSGTYNAVAIYQRPQYVKPEELRAFEVGIKTTLFDGALQLNDGFFYASSNADNLAQKPYTVLGARLSYLYARWGLRATIYGRNIGDEKFSQGLIATDFGSNVTLAAPATYGLRLSWDF